MCREFGWTVDHILEMPARRFFAVRKSLFEIKKEERYLSLMDQCDVQSIALGDGKYYNEVKNMYKANIAPPKRIEKQNNPRLFVADDPADSARFEAIMRSAFQTKARCEGIRLANV